MSEAKKIMNTAETIHITDEDRKAALAFLNRVDLSSVEETLDQYMSELDSYCLKYDVKNHYDLMTLADELKFEPKICSEILDKYSFIQRHQA